MKERLITVAATLLAALGLNALIQGQLRSEPTVVQGQGRFAAVQFSRSEGGWWFFDTRTGDLWIYDEQRKLPLWHFRVRELGAPLEQVQLRQTAPTPPSQARP